MVKKFFLQTRLDNTKRSARFWILLIVSGLLAVVIALTIATHLSWGRQQAQIATSYREARASTVKLIASDRLTLESFVEHQATLEQATRRLCEHGILEQTYRQIVSSAQKEYQGCLDKQGKLNATSRQVSSLVNFIKSERSITVVLSGAQSDLSKLESGGYDKVVARWNQLGGDLTKTEVDKRLMVTHESIKKAVASISAGYGKLLEADKAQNRAEFDNASTDIKNAHAELLNTVGGLDAMRNKQIRKLIDQVDKL